MKTLTQIQKKCGNCKASNGQIEQICRVMGDAVKKTILGQDLTKKEAQYIHANGGKLSVAIRETVTNTLKDMLDDMRSGDNSHTLFREE